MRLYISFLLFEGKMWRCTHYPKGGHLFELKIKKYTYKLPLVVCGTFFNSIFIDEKSFAFWWMEKCLLAKSTHFFIYGAPLKINNFSNKARSPIFKRRIDFPMVFQRISFIKMP